MLLAFASVALRSLCQTEEKAIVTFGIGTAATLKRRLADMRATDFAANLPVGRPSVLNGAFANHMSLEIGDRKKVIFCANHNDNPILADGSTNWAKVSRVKIVHIGVIDA